MKIRLTYALLALSLGHSGVALAQEQVWLRDRRYGEGIGLRAGDLEVHPGVAGEFGYDSNYFLRAGTSSGVPVENVIDTLRLRITPSLSVATISQQRREAEGGGGEPPKVAFRAGASASYSEFFATKSQNSDVLKNQRNVGGTGTIQLQILPQRPLGGDMYADFFGHSSRPTIPEFNFNRFNVRAGAGIGWAPGGGMFDSRLGYEYGLVFFEDSSFRNLSNVTNQVNLRGRFRFLPRTALMYDASLGFVRYNENPSLQLLDSDPVRARIGLNGLVTSSFAVLALVGWGSSFYHATAAVPNPNQFDGPIAQAEVKWFITPNPGFDPKAATLALSALSLGYTRDFYNSYLGDYYTRDRGYVNLSYFFGGRVLAVADAGLGALRYPAIRVPVHAAFTSTVFDASLFGEYRTSNSVGINATVRYSSNSSVTVGPDNLSWSRFEGFAGVRWFM